MPRVWVGHGDNDTRDFFSENGVHARRRAAKRTAGFHSDIQCATNDTTIAPACVLNGFDFRVRPAGLSMKAFAEQSTKASFVGCWTNQHRANAWVGGGKTSAAFS